MKRLCILLALLVSLAACEEDPTQGLLDIIDRDLGYVPVIAGFSIDGTTGVSPGEQRTLDLRYWSEGDIERVQVWESIGEETDLVYDDSYQPAYSYETRTDSLLVTYTVPDVETGTTVGLEARVWNEGLEDYPATQSLELNVVE